ncbi:hypothetical protein V8G54_017822 [Vigna mungo]|uniref:TF-B3 domain-containing protein n=1 Tax=Vigna mungo TaxID=3915 RepID=A0AAQ3S0M6_VIGMU
MTNPVTLSLPNGTKNKVHWVNKDGDVWLCNGWKEFAKYSKLDVSHFLVFRYEGNSCFNVIIFGKSALEIEYPLSREAANEKVEEIIEGGEFSAKFSEKGSKRPKEELQVKEEQPKKHSKTRACSDYSKHMNNGSEREKKVRLFQEKVKEMFNSKNIHFTSIIRKSYTERNLLIIPAEFSKHYLHKEGLATLFVEDGRTWEVETKLNFFGQLTFSSGWRKFLLDNKLKVDDVCVFELLENPQFLFKVTIYPLQEEDSTTPLFKGQKGVSHLPSSSLKTPMTTQARTPKPNDDLFICIKSEFPTIPYEYAKKYAKEDGRLVTFRVGDKSWQVKFLFYDKHHFGRFSRGWHDFARDCDLKMGDACIFRMKILLGHEARPIDNTARP